MKYRIKKIDSGFTPQARTYFFFWVNIVNTVFSQREYAMDWIRWHNKRKIVLKYKPNISFEYIDDVDLHTLVK
jgi:hypothetical protein